MTKNHLYLSLTHSMQQALHAAQYTVWTQYHVWTLFIGMDEPQEVVPDERQITVHLMAVDSEAIEVSVYLVKVDSGWRVIQSSLVKKGEWTVSTQRFDFTRITYCEAEERERFASKNECIVARLNSGEKFAFITDRYGQLSGGTEPISPYYSFIVMRNGELLPLPIFFEAACVDMLTAFGKSETKIESAQKIIVWHDATEAEIDAYLRQTFGEQYLKSVRDREEMQMLN